MPAHPLSRLAVLRTHGAALERGTLQLFDAPVTLPQRLLALADVAAPGGALALVDLARDALLALPLYIPQPAARVDPPQDPAVLVGQRIIGPARCPGPALGARELLVRDEAVTLSPTEYAICELLARRPGQVMSRAQIREEVMGWDSESDDAAISMQVSRARRKLAAAGADPIATVWGMGYKWRL